MSRHRARRPRRAATPRAHGLSGGLLRRPSHAFAGLFALVLLLSLPAPRVARAEIQLPQPNPQSPITVNADAAHRWQHGAYEVWLLRGKCKIQQGASSAVSDEAVLWIEKTPTQRDAPTKIIAYLENGVSVKFYDGQPGQLAGPAPLLNLSDKSWFGRFYTYRAPQINAPVIGGELDEKPPIFHRGMAQLDPNWKYSVQPAQFAEALPDPVVPDPIPQGTRRIRVFPRSDVPVQAQWFPSAGGQQWMAVIDSGVNLIVDGVENVGTIDAAADRLVIWTAGIQPDLSGQALQRDDLPFEVYLEGNIVFRQGERVIYAQRMYYDVRNQIGIVLDAELLTPVPNYAGMLRMKARVLRQLDANSFVGNQALLTSSRLGNPRYSLTSDEIFLEDRQSAVIDPFTGAPQLDPETGAPLVVHDRLATSTGNRVNVADVPVFYWPTMATDLEEPQYYINSFTVRTDQVFGTQVLTGFDAYQLFGVRNAPEGTDWDLDLDYLSQRGPAAGTRFEYDNLDFLGVAGPARGSFDAWGIYDEGTDNLGGPRRNVPPPQDWRGRVRAWHQQQLPNNYTLTAELGLISDRNFLEQYFEREWDTGPDQRTGLELKQIVDNRSWSVTSDVRLNDFFTETEWLPRVDHFWLGEALLDERLTWFEHSQIGYGRLRTASPPTDPTEAAQWGLLPWEEDVEGARLITRQEFDMPLEAGPVKIVPYALGELAHWGEALDGDPLTRGYVQTGARASIPFWTVNPYVEDYLFNLHGLSHKVVFETEIAYSDSNRNMTDLPLYDPLDDNATEDFRRRFQFYDFGGVTPTRFDPRFYALRSGQGGYVTSPTPEIADDLMTIRTGMRHRWQTKRGHPDNRQIVDWIVFDTNATWFPREDRDNFGESVGLIDYDFRWHVGDRLTLLSSGIFDVYPDGFKEMTVGGFLNRPPRGNLFVGLRTLQGPIDATVLNMSYNYLMSPKWISSFGTSIDLANTDNIGQNFRVTRIGESLLVSLGFDVDMNKDLVGVNFLIEPRFLPVTRSGRALGAQIPPAGAFGLE